MIILLKQAWRMVAREFHAGEYRLTLFAMIIGVTAVMSLSLISSRIENSLFSQSTDLIGGNLVLHSSTPPSSQHIEITKNNAITASLSTSLVSMVSNGEDFVLSSVRALDDNYPLRGKVSLKNAIDQAAFDVVKAPKPGTAWVEKRLLDKLNLQLGDELEIGYAKIKALHFLDNEPDRAGDFYSFNPRILIHQQDLVKSELIQPGSHVHYKYMVVGESDKLDNWLDEIKPTLSASQRLLDAKTSKTRISKNLQRASAFISLGSLMSVILCAIAVALAAWRFANRHVNQVALLRCFGLKSRQVNLIYGLQIFIISVPAILVGMVLGYYIHVFLMQILAEFFKSSLPPASIHAWLSGPLTAMSMMVGFAMPAILQLAKTPPVRVLRKEMSGLDKAPFFSFIIGLVCLTIIAWWQTKNIKLALLSISGTIVIISVLLVLIRLLFKYIKPNFKNNASLRAAYANLLARPMLTAMQIMAFAISAFAIMLILLFRQDLFDRWQQEVPENAPNRFVYGILESDAVEFVDYLSENKINTDLYPIVRGRLTHINNRVVQKAVSKEDEQSSEEALHRDLALTQVSALPDENVIVKGEVLPANINLAQASTIPVSVESELAENLDLKLNDTLTFLIAGKTLNATITSFRRVNWENFKPNFYMLFPQGALDEFSKSMLTSYHLPTNQSAIDSKINKRFPSITVINVDFILKRVRRILNQVSAAMETIFSMTIFAGISIFWASMLITFDEKQKSAALLRALGASRHTVRQRFVYEHLFVGFFAGIVAALSLAIVSYLVSTRVLEITWQFPWLYCISLPLILMILLSTLGSFQLKSIMSTPPQSILQRV